MLDLSNPYSSGAERDTHTYSIEGITGEVSRTLPVELCYPCVIFSADLDIPSTSLGILKKFLTKVPDKRELNLYLESSDSISYLGTIARSGIRVLPTYLSLDTARIYLTETRQIPSTHLLALS